MRRHWSSFVLLLLTLLVLSCGKDDDDPPQDDPIDNPEGKIVYVINEGNFQQGTASLTTIFPESNEVEQDVFERVNGFGLGDVFQSMLIEGNRAYLVVNNSGKIEVVDSETFELQETISGLTSPRYLLLLPDNVALVSDLFGPVSKLDLNSFTITTQLETGTWTEEMVWVNNSVFAAAPWREYVYEIDPDAMTIIDSIWVGKGAENLRKDANDRIWVLARGEESENIKPQLTRFNPTNNSIEWQEEFDDFPMPAELEMNGAGNQLFFLRQDVYGLDITATDLSELELVASGENRNYYGLGIDPENGDVYVCDAKDFVQRGQVIRFDSEGTKLGEFEAGLIPGDFYFR